MGKDKKKLIEDFFEKGLLVQEDLAYSDEIKQTIFDTIESEADLLVLNKDYLDILEQQKSLVDWYEIDGYKVEAEKERNEELYQSQLQLFKKAGLSITQPGCQQRQHDEAREELPEHEPHDADAEVADEEEGRDGAKNALVDGIPDVGARVGGVSEVCEVVDLDGHDGSRAERPEQQGRMLRGPDDPA